MRTVTLRRVRLAASLFTAAAGVYLLVGCIPVPAGYQREGGGERPERIVQRALSQGDAGHRLTHDQIISLLGPPGEVVGAESEDGSMVYAYNVVTSYWVIPTCLTVSPATEPRFLRLTFDEAGELKDYRVYKSIGEFAGKDLGYVRPRGAAPRQRGGPLTDSAAGS